MQNKLSLTKCLHEAYLKTVVEAETLNSKKKLIQDDFDLVDATITGKNIIGECGVLGLRNFMFSLYLAACSKFTLSLTGPDFTAHKVHSRFLNS